MKLVVLGATGNVGPHLVAELLGRNHQVTAISRHPERLEQRPGMTRTPGDVSQPAALARLLAGHDAIISSVRFADFEPDQMLAAVEGSGVRRYLVVGGAGSLLDAEGRLVCEKPGMPEPVQYNSRRGNGWLERLKGTALDWSMLCPGQRFIDGERTGVFRLGLDHLIVAADGSSSISFQDFAIALADEVEVPRHVGRRFAVGY